MTELGQFQEGFNSFRRMLAGVPLTNRLPIFLNAASEAATYLAKGCDRTAAADELTAIATANGLDDPDAVQFIISRAFDKSDEIERVPDPPPDEYRNGKSNGHDAKPTDPVPVIYPFPLQPKEIPRRAWLVPGLLLRRQVSVLVAPPGSGKSLLTLQIALMLATAKPWAGWHPRQPVKTLVINSEDDGDEMRRRLYAAVSVMECNEAEIGNQIAFADAPENIIIARADSRTKTVIRMPMIERIIATIIKGGFDVVIIDPFAECFEGDENSNSELKWCAVLWREIGRRTNAGVMLVHHTKKYGAEAGNMDSARGGGALVGVARIVSTLFSMTDREAEAFEIDADKRHEYLRFDDAKSNLSLINFNAKWFRKRSFKVPNGNEDEPPDEVGALQAWTPPSIFDQLDTALARTILLAIDFGITDEQGAPTGDLFTLTRKGRNAKRWAGTVVQDHLGGADRCSDKEAQKALNVWHKAGVLTEIERTTSTSKGSPRKGLKVNLNNLPGEVVL